jgi:acyl-CoA thioesterase-1
MEDAPESSPSSSTETRTILALGDSLTAGYGLPVSESYPAQLEEKLKSLGYRYTIQNAGISGDTSA